MATTDCLLEAAQVIRDDETLDEATRREVLDVVQRIAKDQQLSDEQKVARTIQAMREARKDIYLGRVTRLADEAAMNRLRAEVEELPEDEQLSALRRRLEVDKYIDSPGPAVSNLVRAEEQRAAGAMHEVWEALVDRWKPWVQDSKFAELVHKEARGVDTGVAEAKRLAAIYHKVSFEYVERLRQAGVYVGNRDNYAPQSHDMSRIIADIDGWRAYLRENLDPTLHPDPEATAARLQSRLSTRHLDDPQGATISMGRQIEFKSPEAEFEYFMRFGDGDFSQTLFSNVRALARKAVLAEQLGPSSARNLDAVLDPALRRATERQSDALAEGDKKRASGLGREIMQGRRANWIAESLTGELHNPANQSIAHWGAAARNWMTAQMLGKVPLSIVGQDALNSVIQSRFHTGGFGRAMTQQLKAMVEVWGQGPARRYAEELGVWSNALHASSLDRFSSTYANAEAARGLTRRAATATQRMAGTYMLDRTLRSATMLTLSRNLMRATSTNWGDLNPRYQRVLRANGFDAGTWQRLQRSAQVQEGTGAMNVNALPRELRDRTLAFLYRELDIAVVHPQHFDRALLAAGLQAGTVGGEVAASMTQFWSWPVAFVRGPMRREWAMGGTGFIGFSAGMIASGVLTVQLYALASNQPAYEWDSPTLWQRGIARSGLLTPVGELAMEAFVRGDAAISGPVTDIGFGAIGTLGSAATDFFVEDDSDRAARKIAQLGKDLTIPNLWQLEYSVTSRAMDYLMWELDPAYMTDRERRWAREGRMQ